MLSIIFQMGNQLLGQYFEEYYIVLEALSKSRIGLMVDNIVIYLYTKMSTSHQKVTGKQHVTVIKYLHHFFCSWFERTPKNNTNTLSSSAIFPGRQGGHFCGPWVRGSKGDIPGRIPSQKASLKDAAAAGPWKMRNLLDGHSSPYPPVNVYITMDNYGTLSWVNQLFLYGYFQ